MPQITRMTQRTEGTGGVDELLDVLLSARQNVGAGTISAARTATGTAVCTAPGRQQTASVEWQERCRCRCRAGRERGNEGRQSATALTVHPLPEGQ